jgi:quinoprotein glucose dehydrogenase
MFLARMIAVMWTRLLFLSLTLTAMACISAPAQEWGTFNGDLKAQKYSPLKQITPEMSAI